MRRESFPLNGPLRFEIATSSGDVEILPGADGEVVVELRNGPVDDYTVELEGSILTVRPPRKTSGKSRYASTDIKVVAPAGAAGSVRTSSGDVFAALELSSLNVATASGDCRVQAPVADDFEAKSASGDIRLRNVGGSLTVATASGDIAADDIGGDLHLNSASGDVRLGSVAGRVEAKTVSGDISVGNAAGPVVRAKSLSGDVRLGIPAGRVVDLDMQTISGTVTNHLKKTGEQTGERRPLVISIKTISGSLRLENA